MSAPHAPCFRVEACRHGLGVFAQRDIAPGETILRFDGPRIGVDAMLAKGERRGDVLQIARDQYLDIAAPGRLVNHSCAPNAGVVGDRSLVALRAIAPGEEITYDYSTTMGDGDWTLRCACGAESCRGEVVDFKGLLPALRERYLRLGVVMAYLREEPAPPFELEMRESQ